MEVKNFFGIYGSTIADFLLQSFGLASFLFLANLTFWGLNLLIKKEIKKILLKLFFMVTYLIFGSVFIYLTFNNSFWLIDNGNSGFVGEISYSFISSLFPWVDNKYSISVIFFLTMVFFIFSSDIKVKDFFVYLFKIILSVFKKKNKAETVVNIIDNENNEEVLMQSLNNHFYLKTKKIKLMKHFSKKLSIKYLQ